MANLEPTGHAVRMDALHLIRAAAEFADVLERDAQSGAAAQIRRTEVGVTRRQRELSGSASRHVERYRGRRASGSATSLQRCAQRVSRAPGQATTRLDRASFSEAEARGARLLEQSRHQATELTNSARAEVEQTLDWARAQAVAMRRARPAGRRAAARRRGSRPRRLTEVVRLDRPVHGAGGRAARLAADRGARRSARPFGA